MAKLEWQASLGLNGAAESPVDSPRSVSSSGAGVKLPKDLPCFRSPQKNREYNIEDASEFLQLLEAELEKKFRQGNGSGLWPNAVGIRKPSGGCLERL